MTAMNRMKTSEDPDDKISSAIDAAEVCLVGWENMTDPVTGEAILFSRETIGDILSIEELAEVFEAVTSAALASSADRKKSELPPS